MGSAHLSFVQGDIEAGAADLLAVLAMGRHAAADHTLIGMLVQSRFESLAIDALAGHLHRLDREQLEAFAQALDGMPDRVILAQAIGTERILAVMQEMFDIDPADVTLQSRLYEDLDIDSIDAVDLVVELKKITGRKMQPDDFKSVRTVEDVVDAVSRLLLDD